MPVSRRRGKISIDYPAQGNPGNARIILMPCIIRTMLYKCVCSLGDQVYGSALNVCAIMPCAVLSAVYS